MLALALAVSVLFGVTADIETDIIARNDIAGIDGVIASYPCMDQPMGLDYDHTHGWLWQATQNGGWVYTIDPSNGAYMDMFDLNIIFGSSDLCSNGCYIDETDNYLYLTDYNGDLGVTFNDVVYCFNVDDPYNPVVVDTWDFGTLDGIAGLAYKAPHFYCTYLSAFEIRAFTLSPGGAFTLENTWAVVDYGGMWYDEIWNVFYTHDAKGTEVHILDGDDLSIVLDSFTPGCTELTISMTDDPDPAILWTTDRPSLLNIQIDDEYIPAALENSTWGNIKTVF